MKRYINVKLNTIRIDPTYQRPADPCVVKMISKDFSWALFGTPELSMRADGSLWAVDAQHRIAGAVLAGHGDKEVKCAVHDGLTIQEESMLFYKLNELRRRPRVFYRFRARLEGGDPFAQEVDKVVRGVGLKLAMDQGPRDICAVEKCESVQRKYKNLGNVLGVLKACYGHELGAYDGKLIAALGMFLDVYPEVDSAAMVRRMGKFSPARLIAKLVPIARDISKRQACVSQLREIYNTKNRKDVLPLRYEREE